MYEDLDEVLMYQNPKGGRPQMIGKMLLTGLEKAISEANDLKEETQIRYHLGYCTCSKKIVIGEKRARLFMEALNRNRFVMEKERVPIKVKLARFLIHALTPA